MKRVFMVAAAAMIMAGCAGMNAAMQYKETQVQDFASNAHDWRIFDKPDEGRLMMYA